MTRENLSLTEIETLWRAEKPLYLAIEENGNPKRRRILSLRILRKHHLQVKTRSGGEWENIDRRNVVYAC